METLIKPYKKPFLKYLSEQKILKAPENLYRPIEYILNLGGKRLRPILALMICDLYGQDPKKAYDAALAIEIFHNFTLIHDDIMDEASIRRGKKTVHKKWGLNVGVLSGDAMMIKAYRCLESYEPEMFKRLMIIFSKTALEVCEGQQLDLDFETRNDVTIEEYINMITLKTSVLLGASMKIGAIIADTSLEENKLLYNFGLQLGIAFQLQDDYLDTFGDPKSFGKKIGGDILENKKTYLYITALKDASDEDREKLLKLYSTTEKSQEKIDKVVAIFEKYDIPAKIQEKISYYTDQAFDLLEKIHLEEDKKEVLREFGEKLMARAI